MRASILILALASLPALGQERGFEFGTRYWHSSGENRFAHNAQGVDPTLGNPTSILTYDDLDARALALHWRTGTPEGWFFKGNFGLGKVRGGGFDVVPADQYYHLQYPNARDERYRDYTVGLRCAGAGGG